MGREERIQRDELCNPGAVVSEAEAIVSIGRTARNVELIRQHGRRSFKALFCIVRLADLEHMAGMLGPESAELAIDEFVSRIRGLLRTSDELIPLSARTWALVLKGITGEDHVLLLIARLERLLAQPVIIFEEPVILKINLGYAVIDGNSESAESVFWMAERALEDAKSSGRIAAAPRATQENSTAKRWALEAELRQALDDGEFRLYFQPKLDARFRRIVGAEALVRWHSRRRGIVPPGAFIEVVEASDLAAPFTHFIFKHALALASAWPGELSVAVNLPPVLLSDVSLIHTITDAISIFDFEAERLEVEVTEGSLMQDLATSRARLAALRATGARVSIDDFGTGQSSLAQLRTLPLDQLKIDRSFVKDLDQQPELTKYIIDLARALKLTVVAEGVETEAQAQTLTEQGADYLQGYWIAKPMPQDTFVEWLGSRGVF